MDATADPPILPFQVREDLPPADCLPAVPLIHSTETMTRAMSELIWIASRDRTLTAKAAGQLGLVNRQISELVAELDAIPRRADNARQIAGVPFDQRIAALQAAIADYLHDTPRAA